MQSWGKAFLAQEKASTCRGGSDKPSPGRLLKWARSSAAPQGGRELTF